MNHRHVFALVLWVFLGFGFAAHAQKKTTAAEEQQLTEVNAHWAAQARMASGVVKNKIIILMIDDDSFRKGSLEALWKILEVVGASSPRAIFLDMHVPAWVSPEGKQLVDKLYPNITWAANSSGYQRNGARGSLALGIPEVKMFAGHEPGNRFGLLEPCVAGQGPNAAFLAWEMSGNVYSLPYHADCSRWYTSYALLKTASVQGRLYIPFQYFGDGFFTKVSSTALLAGQVNPSEFGGKTVLVGSVLPGKSGRVDRHITSVGVLDGTEILAHALGTLMSTLKY
ncbi:MAG: CHASE2 domain-containing protein [bacterium]|nr:CHASE2 domain-containing protein [bacterium]